MEGLKDIATTGAPMIVTALGMGTVFSCLILLYVTTRLMGSGLSRLLNPRESKQSAAPAAAAGEASGSEAPEAMGATAPAEAGIAAAITLVLARHRAARVAPVAQEAAAADPWKIAGRMRVLRAK